MQNNNSRFFDGFLMGALVGGAAVFLLGTKKGNKIIKLLSEGGLEDISEMFSDFEEGVSEGIKKTVKDVEKKEEKDIKKIEEKLSNGTTHSPVATQGVRRFFRKSKS